MKLREIERLRALAVLMVVFTHTGPHLPILFGIFQHPRTGVDLFFVISGFVVTRSLLRRMPDLTHASGIDSAFEQSRTALRVFFMRRFFRIVPLAVAVVVLQGLLLLVLPPSALGGDLNDYWHEVCAIFMGVYNYTRANAGYSQFGVYWSLSVEEHFYLLLPILFLLARTRKHRLMLALAGIAFVALVCRTFFDEPPAGTADPLMYRVCASHLRFDALFAGVALALVSGLEAQRPFMPRWFVQWLVVPVCVAVVWAIPRALPSNTYFHQGFTATWFFCAMLVSYASLDRGYVFSIPIVGRVLEHVGARSYAIYLLHIPLRRMNDLLAARAPSYGHFRADHPWTQWAVLLLAVGLAAEVSWRVLEWPAQRLGQRLTEGARGTLQPAATVEP